MPAAPVQAHAEHAGIQTQHPSSSGCLCSAFISRKGLPHKQTRTAHTVTAARTHVKRLLGLPNPRSKLTSFLSSRSPSPPPPRAPSRPQDANHLHPPPLLVPTNLHPPPTWSALFWLLSRLTSCCSWLFSRSSCCTASAMKDSSSSSPERRRLFSCSMAAAAAAAAAAPAGVASHPARTRGHQCRPQPVTTYCSRTQA
jgi:hypothetical protein